MTKAKNHLPAILTPAKSGITGRWDQNNAISDADLQNPRIKKYWPLSAIFTTFLLIGEKLKRRGGGLLP